MSAVTNSTIAAQATHIWCRRQLARHLIEMYLAMQIGMGLGPLLLAVALGASVSRTRQEHPLLSLLVMALSMTLPMTAWMLHRGHSRRSAGEMAAAMLAPALPFIGLQMGHVVSASGCGGYMSASTIAMVALIIYRRSEYRATAEAHAAKARSLHAHSRGSTQLKAAPRTIPSTALDERKP